LQNLPNPLAGLEGATFAAEKREGEGKVSREKRKEGKTKGIKEKHIQSKYVYDLV